MCRIAGGFRGVPCQLGSRRNDELNKPVLLHPAHRTTSKMMLIDSVWSEPSLNSVASSSDHAKCWIDPACQIRGT